MTTTMDFILFLLADICFFVGAVWSWRGTWGGPNPVPGWTWAWPLYAGLLLFTLPWLIASAQHLS